MRLDKLRMITFLLCTLVLLILLPGCTNWKQLYEDKVIEYENCIGRIEGEQSEKSALALQNQQIIDELRRQIEELQKTPAEASGFGQGYDVAFSADQGTVTVTLSNSILFDSGKAELKSATSTELDHIRDVIKDKYDGKQIDVIGHTDTDPISASGWVDNWQLSAERALTVTRYLINKGIHGNEIRAVGCGQSRPIESNSTAAGKAKNRRVEIVVHIT